VGLFGAVGNGLSGLFGDGFAEKAAMANAILNDDNETAARIAGQRGKERAAAQLQAQLVGALRNKGMSDNDIAIILANPDKFSEAFSSRFQTRGVDEGSSVYTPNLNGGAAMFTAPKIQKEGADVIQTQPLNVQLPPPSLFSPGQGGTPAASAPADGNPNFQVTTPTRLNGLRSQAEQYADSVAQKGTKAWGDAVRDYTMKGYGPTAQEMLGQRLDSQQAIAEGHDTTRRYATDHPARGQERARSAAPRPHPPTPTTVIGGIMAKQAAGEPLSASELNTLKEYRTRYKPQIGAVQVTPNEPVAHGPHGQKLVVRNGKWVDAATGQPVQ
jgi:hypothetical protein